YTTYKVNHYIHKNIIQFNPMKKFYLLLGLVFAFSQSYGQSCSNPISSFPYLQNFESGAGGWTSGGTSSSWALGAPSGTVINAAASGSNAWVTNLTGTYNNNEDSYVQSPCFNMTSLNLP